MNARPNPYVGPRAFKRGEVLSGRNREAKALFHLLVAERIVLLYSPSGAGKTSLIQSELIPIMEKNNFEVLTWHESARVSTEPPPDVSGSVNRYLYSTALSISEGYRKAGVSLGALLSGQNFKQYLDGILERSGRTKTPLLILDQFEEILTKNPTDLAAKREFFEQVGEVLRDEHIWALFAMREEYRSALDPYRNLIPTRFHSTFRLDLLDAANAMKAVCEPSVRAGVMFQEDAAKKLVDELRTTHVQGDSGNLKKQLGPNVEPMLIQVACERLWEALPTDAQRITSDDIEVIGSVDDALSTYYEKKVGEVAKATQMHERSIRDWCEQALVSEQGVRGQILRGAQTSQGLVNRAIEALENAHLVRAEKRREATWYELAHDRLVTPIRDNNRKWREDHLSHFQKRAAIWGKDRSDRDVLKGSVLCEAEKWAEAHVSELTNTEQEFLQICRKMQEKEQLTVRNRRLTALLLVLLLAATYYSYHALWLKTRPWGIFRELSTNTHILLGGAFVTAGRSIEEFKNTLDFRNTVVSRFHLLLTKELIAHDMRSLNGTTINANFLPYGRPKMVEDGDILVLAGIGPIRFSKIEYAPLQFWKPQLPTVVPPSGWGLLIDGASRAVHELSGAVHYVSIGTDGRLRVSDKSDPALVIVRVQRNGSFTIENLEDPTELLVTMKMGDYTFPYCKVPSKVEMESLPLDIQKPVFSQVGRLERPLAASLGGNSCGFHLKRDDLQDIQKTEFGLHEVTFALEGIPFQIVPVMKQGAMAGN